MSGWLATLFRSHQRYLGPSSSSSSLLGTDIVISGGASSAWPSKNMPCRRLQNLCSIADLPPFVSQAKIFPNAQFFLGHGNGPDEKGATRSSERDGEGCSAKAWDLKVVEWVSVIVGSDIGGRRRKRLMISLGFLRRHVGLEVSSEQPPASYW